MPPTLRARLPLSLFAKQAALRLVPTLEILRPKTGTDAWADTESVPPRISIPRTEQINPTTAWISRIRDDPGEEIGLTPPARGMTYLGHEVGHVLRDQSDWLPSSEPWNTQLGALSTELPSIRALNRAIGGSQRAWPNWDHAFQAEEMDADIAGMLFAHRLEGERRHQPSLFDHDALRQLAVIRALRARRALVDRYRLLAKEPVYGEATQSPAATRPAQ